MPPAKTAKKKPPPRSIGISQEKLSTKWLQTGQIGKAIKGVLNKERLGQTHGSLGPALREIVSEARQPATTEKSARSFSRKLTRGVDELIITLFNEGAARYPDTAPLLAILATGGYGRNDLAPYSDIDLLILHADEHEKTVRTLLDFILYPLWDSGLKIGHGTHTVSSAISLAREDFTPRTAFLEKRYLVGSQKLAATFDTGFEKLRTRSASAFVKAKLDDRAGYQER